MHSSHHDTVHIRCCGCSDLVTFLGGTSTETAIQGFPNELLAPEMFDPSGRFVLCVPAGKSLVRSMPLEAKSTLTWSLEVKAHGIEVSAVFVPDEQATVSQTSGILDLVKYKAADGVQDGTFLAEAAGSCVFTFNNAYSMINSKTVIFGCEVHGDCQSISG